ncbi:MAG: PAS domain S-box protein, partial [Gemmatimonadaceae bacterium]
MPPRKRILSPKLALSLFAKLGASVFIGEALIVLLFVRLPPPSPWVKVVLHASLLTVALLPAAYLFFLRPLLRNIREREAAEEARGATESELRAVLDSAADGLLAVDGQGRVLHANQRFYELWRIPPALAASRDDRALLDCVLGQLVDPAQFIARVEALYHSEAEDSDVLQFKDGRTFERYSVAMWHDGERVGRVWSFRDVTARQRADAEAKRSQAILQSVADGTTDAVFVKDLRGLYLMCNSAACGFVGKSRDEVLGHDDTALFGADEARAIMDADREILRAGVTRTYEERATCAGKFRTFSATKGPLRDEQGRVVGLFGISRDITARRSAEEALKERNRFVEALLEHAPVGFAVNTISDGTPVFVSKKFEHIYGVAEGSITSVDDFFERVYPDPVIREQMRSRIMADMMSGDIRRMHWDDVPLTLSNGERRYVNAMNIPLIEQDLMISTVQDVTARKRAEEEASALQAQLQQSRRLESVGLLAGGVAHDFNNMLGVILASAELAMAQVEPAAPLYEDLHEIWKAAERSAELTRQLLTFARQQTILPRRLDLNEAVVNSLEMLRRLVGEHVEVQWTAGETLWSVTVDPSQVSQMLANLCVNASHAISGVGNIGISTENVVVDAAFAARHAEAVPGEFVRLRVQDSGSGISPEVLPRIFEPFFTTKPLGEGTGLGLASVYGAVQQNHGFITGDSRPGQGTTFSIYLPRDEQAAAAEAAPAAERPRRGGETVLVVEDEPAILRL